MTFIVDLWPNFYRTIEIFLILDCAEAMFDLSNIFQYLDLIQYRMGKKLYYPRGFMSF